MFSGETEEVKAVMKRRYANRETVAEADKRIQMIALDIVDHFKGKVKPNGFKAQMVAPSRAAALRYAKYLNDFQVRAYPIITTTPSDDVEFKEARELDQKQVISAFVDPQGEPEILVVVDMLLTGFDAPVEQVLYLDRELKEHGLLQAVARVNRRFSHEYEGVATEKEYGLVVDYHGVSTNLEEAFASFDQMDVQDAMRPMEEDPCGCTGGGCGGGRVPLQGKGFERHLGLRGLSLRRTPAPRATSKPTYSSGSTRIIATSPG